MTPVRPSVVPDGCARAVFGKNQPEYHPLPAYVESGPARVVVTLWEPTAEELAAILNGGRVRLRVSTFGRLLQPVYLDVVEKET